MSLTKRTRLNRSLANKLKLRMEELGFHPEQHMHLGPLTPLFIKQGWLLITKKGNTGVTLYPPHKTLGDVVSELGDW